jgi:UDP-3-O-[3-hydroxymyristoyl] glucosamine N-acyltransferase
MFELIYRFQSIAALLITQTLGRWVFGKVGFESWIKWPQQLFGANRVQIGRQVRIEAGAIVIAVKKYGQKRYAGSIIIGDRVYINTAFVVIAAEEVNIGDNCSIGPNVFISNCDHDYNISSGSVLDSNLKSRGKITVGKGVWIGRGSNILGGITIGDHAVVAAGSVVTKSVPPYCVVGGNPARVIKFYDPITDL